MKKIYKSLLFAFILNIIMITNVNAATLSLTGSNEIKKGDKPVYDVYLGNETDVIKKISFTATVTDMNGKSVTSYIKFTIENNFLGTLSNNDLTSVITGTGEEIKGKVATINAKDFNLEKLDEDKKIIIKLDNISIINDKDEDVYNDKASIKESVMINLKKPIIETTKQKSSNPNFSALTISAGKLTPSFRKDLFEYKVYNIKDTIKSVTISPICDECVVEYECELGCTNGTVSARPTLVIGKNIVRITSLSGDGKESQEYILTIYRGETTENSKYLKTLEIDGFLLNEEFDKEMLDYTLTVPNDSTELIVLATPEDSEAKVEIRGNDKLIIGENVITITVTSAETKEKSIYNITVTRLEEGEVMPTTTKAEPIEKSKNIWLIVLLIILGLGIIGAAAYFIFFKENKGKKEKITDEGNIEKLDEDPSELSVKENELKEELSDIEMKQKPTVDEALADLMVTKEIVLDQKNEKL